MPRAVPPLLSFSGGEISPQLWARTDLDKYGISARTLQNFIPRPQGAAVRRPGTRFVAEARGSAVSRLAPFEFSTVQAYVIEISPQGVLRFFKNGGLILSGPTAYEISHPYGTDIADLRWAQSADVLYLAHPRFAPRKLTRTGDTAWTLTTISFTGTPAEWTGANWPETVTFHDGRLWWGGTPSQPQTMWASKSGDFENLTTGSADDDALKLTLDTDQVNAIRWIKSGRALHVGTAGGEFIVQASETNAPITPSNAQARRQTAEGCAAVDAVQLGQATLFVQRAGKRISQMGYSFEADAYVSADLTLLANHILRAGVREMVWQAEPWRTLWCVSAGVNSPNGPQLLGVTYVQDQRVVAWHRHFLGGPGGQGGATPAVWSICSIPSVNANELWMVVERTINSSQRVYIERMEPDFWAEEAEDLADAVLMDSAITYDGPPATVIGGLDHMQGETVQVLADGAAHPPRTVSVLDGTITLQAPASKVQIGFGYVSRLETLDIDAGAADGTAATRRRRIGEIGVRLFQSLGCKIGFRDPDTAADVLEEVQFREPGMPMDEAPPLFTGEKVIVFPGGWQRECRVVVVQDQPLPLTVLGLVPRVTATE